VIVGGGEEEDSTQQSIGVNRFIMLWWAEGGKDKPVVGSIGMTVAGVVLMMNRLDDGSYNLQHGVGMYMTAVPPVVDLVLKLV